MICFNVKLNTHIVTVTKLYDTVNMCKWVHTLA